MDNLVSLYTSTEGRISRMSWWIGALILMAINLVISLLILPMLGLGMPSAAAITAASSDPAAVTTLVTGALQTASWGSLVLFLLLAYPSYALMVKRRHDKDNNGMDALIYMVLLAVLMLLPALGLAYSTVEVNGLPIPMPTMIYSIVGVIVGIYSIYMLIVLGFLRGTVGPNKYGADPVGGGATVAA